MVVEAAGAVTDTRSPHFVKRVVLVPDELETHSLVGRTLGLEVSVRMVVARVVVFVAFLAHVSR